VADTTIGSVRGNEGFLHYRHRDATELARTESVESIWHLLLHGDLPDATQLNVFRASVGRARVVDPATLELVARLAECIDPPHLVLQAAIGLLLPAAQPTIDLSPDERLADVQRVAAAVPTVLAVVRATRTGASVPQVNPDAGHAADWLLVTRSWVSGTPFIARAIRALF
jgi:citrate synthase